MAKFLQYRDGGKTDEKGISTHLYGVFQGQVSNGLAVTQNSPLGMSVLVSKGRCMIDSADDYPYLGFTDANEVVTITAADGSNPRIDAIVAYVDLSVVDSTNANNPGAFEIVAVAGTPAGAPNAPNDAAVSTAIGLGNPFIRLAHVTVGTGATTITTGNVSDQRVFVGLPDGFIRSSNTLGQSVVESKNLATNAIFLGLGTKGSNQNFTAAEAAITDLSVSITIPSGVAGRKLKLSLDGAINNTTTATHSVRIRETNISGTTLRLKPIYVAAATASESATMWVCIDAPAAGNYTYLVTAAVPAGTGTFQAGSQFMAELL